MTGPSGNEDRPQVGWTALPEAHGAALDAYLAQHGERFTPAALREAAIAAGYTADEVDAAMARQRDRHALQPIRTRARVIVLAAYGLVWLAFAAVYLARPTGYGTGPLLQMILSIALIVALLPSLLWVARYRTDPTRTGRALVALLVVPVVLLVGVAGLCLPFVGSA
jgi:hypothetical protein